MGQLEKYGLYVLCLVIFLILGVTLWGGGDAVTPQRLRTVATKSHSNRFAQLTFALSPPLRVPIAR